MTIRNKALGLLISLGLAAVAASAACSSGSDGSATTVTCGPNTTLQGTTCVGVVTDGGVETSSPDATVITCGPGTVLKDGVCVIPAAAAAPTFAGLATVTSTSTTTAHLTWVAASDAVTTADKISYRIYVSTTTSTESYGSPQYTSLPGKLSFDVTGLDPGGTYFFVVRAVNAAGVEDKNTIEKSISTSSDAIPPQFAGVLFVDFVPSAPAATTGQAKLTWAAGTDNITGVSELAYDVYESTTPSGEDFVGAPKTSVTGTTTATVDGVDYSVSHFYVVLARDKAGNRNPNRVERKLQKVPNLQDHIMPILVGIPGVPNSAKCAREGGCHLGPSAPGGLAMDSVDNAYANLVKIPASARYLPWSKADLLAGTPTTVDAGDAGTLPMGNVSFTATVDQIQRKFGPPYDETTAYRVLPGLPLVSFMYQKITNTHRRTASNDPSNTEMPNPASSGATLTAEERDRVMRWILGGALKGPA